MIEIIMVRTGRIIVLKVSPNFTFVFKFMRSGTEFWKLKLSDLSCCLTSIMNNATSFSSHSCKNLSQDLQTPAPLQKGNTFDRS